jgi:hypothetical protein
MLSFNDTYIQWDIESIVKYMFQLNVHLREHKDKYYKEGSVIDLNV